MFVLVSRVNASDKIRQSKLEMGQTASKLEDLFDVWVDPENLIEIYDLNSLNKAAIIFPSGRILIKEEFRNDTRN